MYTVSCSCLYKQAGLNAVYLGSFMPLVLHAIKFSAQGKSRNQEYLTKNAYGNQSKCTLTLKCY